MKQTNAATHAPQSPSSAFEACVQAPDPVSNEMNKEEERLLTFRYWPVSAPVSASRLARAGLYFVGPDDAVQCFSCSGVLEGWEFGQDVMRRHRQSFPNCVFVAGESDNIPFLKSAPESRMRIQLLESMASSCSRQDSRTTSPSTPDTSFSKVSRIGSTDSAYRSSGSRSQSVWSAVPSVVSEPLDPSEEPDMRVLENRLRSFYRWPVPFISPTDLAATGFYFTGYQDRVRCAFCRGILGMWQKGDDPWEEHRQHFPWCQLSKRKESSLSNASSPLGSVDHSRPRSSCSAVSSSPRPSHHKFPCSPYLASYETRLMTFKNWPPNRLQTPEHLAQAGFFFTGVNDNVRCFHCDGGLRCWEPADDAWQEHAKWFPQCSFLLSTKGEEFVERAQEEASQANESIRGAVRQDYTPTTPLNDEESIIRRAIDMGFSRSSVEAAVFERRCVWPQAPFRSVEELITSTLELENRRKVLANKPVSSPNRFLTLLRSLSRDEETDAVLERLTEENRILKRQRKCKVCLEREVSTVFLPCGHVVSCGTCTPNLRACLSCGRVVRGTVNIQLT